MPTYLPQLPTLGHPPIEILLVHPGCGTELWVTPENFVYAYGALPSGVVGGSPRYVTITADIAAAALVSKDSDFLLLVSEPPSSLVISVNEGRSRSDCITSYLNHPGTSSSPSPHHVACDDAPIALISDANHVRELHRPTLATH